MGGGKGSSPPPPDYGPIAAANEAAARVNAEIAREQLAWAREQYAQDQAVTQQVLDVFLPTMRSEAEAGAADRARYREVFQPLEDRFIQTATNYDTPERREMEAGRAIATVGQAFDAQRRAAMAELESFGIDPSTARAGALDRGLRIAQGAVAAGAATEARRNVENTGNALVGEAINIGRGYPGQVAGAYATAQNAGGGAISGRLGTTASGAQTMGTAPQYGQIQSSILGNWGANTANMYGSWMQHDAAMNQSPWGAIAGTALGIVGGRVFR
jgi:hypothetical protein